MKYIYIVKGTEDGMLDIFSNKKAAYECAVDYACRTDDDWHFDKSQVISYNKACELLRKIQIVCEIAPSESRREKTNAEIEAYPLHSKYIRFGSMK